MEVTNPTPVVLSDEQIAEIEAEIATRDDDGALNSACGEYNCSCHYRIPALCQTVRALRVALEQIQHRCMCCVTMKECSQAVIDIDGITRKALGNQIHGYKVGEK